MKFVKAVLPVMVVALIATALLAPAAATADVFCEEPVGPAEECPALKVVGAGKHVIGVLPAGTKAQLLSTSKEVLMECAAKLDMLGSENMGGQTSFLAIVEEFSFTGCTGACKKVFTFNLSYKFELVALEFMGYISSGGFGAPGTRLESCTFGTECSYSFTNAKTLVDVETDTLAALKIALKGGLGACPKEVFWDIKYLLTHAATGKAVYPAVFP
jgi:hypothetical protein